MKNIILIITLMLILTDSVKATGDRVHASLLKTVPSAVRDIRGQEESNLDYISDTIKIANAVANQAQREILKSSLRTYYIYNGLIQHVKNIYDTLTKVANKKDKNLTIGLGSTTAGLSTVSGVLGATIGANSGNQTTQGILACISGAGALATGIGGIVSTVKIKTDIATDQDITDLLVKYASQFAGGYMDFNTAILKIQLPGADIFTLIDNWQKEIGLIRQNIKGEKSLSGIDLP